ncbi:MAG: hypothetical protein KatS3mg077_2314 [Candidatus Binatia bacterium]|nr:MAG: hypothetical protein KatS3mg077_2314 [Candidatus Binatia bacterium]
MEQQTGSRFTATGHELWKSLFGDSRIYYHPPKRFGKLAVVPLAWRAAPLEERLYLTFAEARDEVRIEETGHVPGLRIRNRAAKPVLLLEGESLQGGWQNRVVTISILVPKDAVVEIPVACVEQGRWSPRWVAQRQAHRGSATAEPWRRRAEREPEYLDPGDHAFESPPELWEPGDFLFAKLKGRLSRDVSRAAREGSRFWGNQSTIWDEISRKATSFRARSRTGAMSDIFERSAHTLEEYVHNLPLEQDQIGFVAAIDHDPLGMELVDHPHTLRAVYPRLLRAYALEAIEEERGASRFPERGLASESTAYSDRSFAVDDAVAFLAGLQKASITVHPSIGLGEQLRITGNGLEGSALHALNGILHLSLFPKSHA